MDGLSLSLVALLQQRFMGHVGGEQKGHECKGWGPSRGSARKRPAFMVFVRRFRPALKWIRAVFLDVAAHVGGKAVGRWFPLAVRLSEAKYIVRCDAPPLGMGGILLCRGAPIAWRADEMTD